MRIGVWFPGQGAQVVGMGEDLFEARPDLLGETADATLGWSLRSVCLEGPEEALTATDRAQPALYALSYALFDEFSRAWANPPVAAAGHSLGEYTALAAAGAYPFFDGLRLVAERGAAMGAAATFEPSGMAALIGADLDAAEGLAAQRRSEGGRLWVANLNAPGQVVVAGGADDMAWVAIHAKDHGVRRAIPLKVAGAFHTPFMEVARPRLDAALAATRFEAPRFAVWSNVDAGPLDDGSMADRLSEQITSPVLFARSLEAMAAAGLDAFVHVGPGDVTAGMAKRTVPDVEVVTVNSLSAIDEAVEQLTSIGTMRSSEEG